MNPQQEQLLAQARAAFRAGRLEQARGLCEQAVKKGAKNPAALFLTGTVLRALSRFDEAVTPLERCAHLEPGDPAVHLLLGHVHLARGKYNAALSRYDRVLKLRPDAAEALRGKAETLLRKGEDAKTHALLEPVVSAGREDAETAQIFARCLHKQGRTEDAITLLRRHGSDREAPPPSRARVNFQLGKMLERAGSFDEAFAASAAANRDLGAVDDPEAYRRRVDELIEVYGADRLARYRRSEDANTLPVLVIGMPRTGSTLVERIIDAHPRAYGAGEIIVLPDLVSALSLKIGSTKPYPHCVADMTAEAATRIGREYLAALARLGRNAKRVVDKHLISYEYLGLVSLILPGARVIDCRRDPMDTCLSCFMEPLAAELHPYASDLTHLGRRYREYERLMTHWQGVLDLPMMTVRYEDLVDDQDAMSRRIIEFVGLPWDDRCLRYYESSRDALTLSREQVNKPIYRTSVNRSARFLDQLGPLRAALDADVDHIEAS